MSLRDRILGGMKNNTGQVETSDKEGDTEMSSWILWFGMKDNTGEILRIKRDDAVMTLRGRVLLDEKQHRASDKFI